MDLSNVPFFQRPMSAKSSDRPTGNRDEAGNIEYVTVTGQTYFIKPAEDQRTTRTKIEEDVIPAAKEYLEDPSLPSAEQMKQFGVDAVQGAYESVKGAVGGTGTMGDVFGVAPAIGAVSSLVEVPEGALRSFGGKEVVDLGKAREDKKLGEFHKSLQSNIKDQIKKIGEATTIAREKGVFDGFETGDRFLTKNGPLEIEGVFLRKVNPESTLLKKSFERFGVEPEFVEFEGEKYVPMVRTKRGTPDSDDYEQSEAYLQLMKEAKYPKMGGLKSAFNEGGLALMDEQMKAFKQEGGLTDDGQTLDPVSGNEIPPGSLAEEVRDDVDAKLSDGEYVVPADVVRFFGVSYFEKLRKKAKEGLAEMEEDGRIGGEPLPETPEDDLPFSDEELMSMEDEAPVTMAEGGVVNSGFDASNFQPGFSEQAGGSIETKTFINAAGDQKSIMFIGGSPIQQIPAGYMEATPENRAQLARETEAQNMSESPTAVDFDAGMTGSAVSEGFASEAPDYSSMSAEELGQAAESIGSATRAGQMASFMGVPFGGVMGKAADAIASKSISSRAEELGIPDPLGKDGKESPKGFIGNVTEAISNVFSGGNTGGISTAPGNYQGPTESGKAGYSVGPAASGSSSGGASGDDSGDEGETGYGGGFGGYANKGMLVNKKVKQKIDKPKPEGKGLVKRKPKKK